MRDPLARVEKVAIKSAQVMPGTAAVLALLAEIRDELRGLRADLAASAPRAVTPIAAYDRNDAELLRAIAATSEGRKFSVSGLLERVEAVEDRAADRRLRQAIVAALGTVDGRRLGQLLRRVENADIEQLRVVRVGENRDGIAWRIASSAGSELAETVDPSAPNVKGCASGT
jgi:hypothetical protein